VIEFLDGASASARRIGAVNTLVKRDGQLIGENTDVYGILQSLREADVDPRGARVVVLGAGERTRAVVFALARRSGEHGIINRTASRADGLESHWQRIFGGQTHGQPTTALFERQPDRSTRRALDVAAP